MKKQLLSVLLVFCVVFGLAACGAAEHPEGWDAEAKFLEWFNGFEQAKTAEELKPFVCEGTTVEQMEAWLQKREEQREAARQEQEEIWQGFQEPQETILPETEDSQVSTTPMWVVPPDLALDINNSVVATLPDEQFGETEYDYVIMALIDNYKGYEIICYQASGDYCVMFGTQALKIENNRYVSSLDEKFNLSVSEKYKKYELCVDCSGGITSHGEGCWSCDGTGKAETGEQQCKKCNTIYSEEDMNTGAYDTCPECGTYNEYTPIIATCEECQGTGFYDTDCEKCKKNGASNHTCDTCDGKGWIKNRFTVIAEAVG